MPNSQELQSLKDCEQDLSQKHAMAFDHRGQPPHAGDDRAILDGMGEQVQPGEEPQLLLALPPPQLEPQAMPALLAPASEQPSSSRRGTVQSDLSLKQIEDLRARDAGWYFDPDGQPTRVTEGADQFLTPPPRYGRDKFRYRTSWVQRDGVWKKLEDKIEWDKLTQPEGPLPEPADRLLSTFSQSGHMETGVRGAKRDDSEIGEVPKQEDRPDPRSGEVPSAASTSSAQRPDADPQATLPPETASPPGDTHDTLVL